MSAARVAVLALAAAAWVAPVRAEAPVVLDDFEDVSHWSAHPADGVEVTIGQDTGAHGKAMRLDFRFVKGGGYAVVRRALPLTLPPHYRFRFAIRGEAPVNDLEFKLLAPGMENVWWRNQRAFRFPREWQDVTIRKRQIEFAWGPVGGGEMKEVAALELAITAGEGGQGTVWIDDLVLEPLPPPAEPQPPVARASSSARNAGAALAIDGDTATAWRSTGGARAPRLDVDLGAEREFGGLIVRWAPGAHARDYDVALSSDGERWTTTRTVRGGDGGADFLLLPEREARHVRIAVAGQAPKAGVAVREVEVQPLEWGSTRERFFAAIAKESPRGTYPRGITGEQSYWTVLGVDRDRDEAMLSEDGMLESGKGGFSIEPFLREDGRLVTWADVALEQGLQDGVLPMPWVRWKREGTHLAIETFATGEPGASAAVARYTVRNTGTQTARGTLYLAVRPFQVNPPPQFLNMRGGTAPVRTLEIADRVVRVNGEARIACVDAPAAFGASAFDAGDVTTFLREGRVPPDRSVTDAFEAASGALAYPYELAPGATRHVEIAVSIHGDKGLAAAGEPAAARTWAADARASVRRAWAEKLGRVAITVPDSEVVRTLRAQIGWILVNRDGAAIQPGSRSYERSWIRDGSLTSSALLRMGHAEDARAFVEWFAPYQYDDGKVPCCVDRRGSDPVPENDSGGEFIYAVAEVVRYTGDTAFGAAHWPRVARAATYLDSLRNTHRTPEWRARDKAHFFGLLPPSISHEGYSAKPMHSYWDDFFALKGFADAAWLAERLGRRADAARWAKVRDEFERELVASIAAAMRVHKIDYIPGCADLGDFDATSTTIALAPVGALGALPRAAVEATFERYWIDTVARRDGKQAWEAMTPYEIRNLGAFVRLGWRERANELLAWYMTLRRPSGFAHWAEVVASDARAPRFIGDMPHTWVGSDFVRAALDMLAYERDDGALVLGAGAPWRWLAEGQGVRVERLPTAHGLLSYTMRARGEDVEVRIESGTTVPAAGFVVAPPARTAFRRATIDGRRATLAKGTVTVRALPAVVRFEP